MEAVSNLSACRETKAAQSTLTFKIRIRPALRNESVTHVAVAADKAGSGYVWWSTWSVEEARREPSERAPSCSPSDSPCLRAVASSSEVPPSCQAARMCHAGKQRFASCDADADEGRSTLGRDQ